MRFTRATRFDPIDFNNRRQAAFARKQRRERDRYPLFAEHVAAEQHSVDEEIGRRQRRADNLERTTRELNARTWRSARRLFFSQPEPVKAQIREKWANWRGPTTSQYFAYIVDELSGERARRVAKANRHTATVCQRVRAALGTQATMDIA